MRVGFYLLCSFENDFVWVLIESNYFFIFSLYFDRRKQVMEDRMDDMVT